MNYQTRTGVTLLQSTGHTLHVHSQAGNTFLHETASWPLFWNYDINSKSQLCQSTHIYLKNMPAKFHPDPIKNDRALGFFEDVAPNKKKNNNKMSSDIRSVPDWKNVRHKTALTIFGYPLDCLSWLLKLIHMQHFITVQKNITSYSKFIYSKAHKFTGANNYVCVCM